LETIQSIDKYNQISQFENNYDLIFHPNLFFLFFKQIENWKNINPPKTINEKVYPFLFKKY
jgi:hypothetical protein